MDTKFGVINEQGFLGEGFGFTEASEEEKRFIDGKKTHIEDDEDKKKRGKA